MSLPGAEAVSQALKRTFYYFKGEHGTLHLHIWEGKYLLSFAINYRWVKLCSNSGQVAYTYILTKPLSSPHLHRLNPCIRKEFISHNYHTIGNFQKLPHYLVEYTLVLYLYIFLKITMTFCINSSHLYLWTGHFSLRKKKLWIWLPTF